MFPPPGTMFQPPGTMFPPIKAGRVREQVSDDDAGNGRGEFANGTPGTAFAGRIS
jgi:hypothetical protein